MRPNVPALLIVLVALYAPGPAYGGAELFPQRKDLGDVFGLVVDARTSQPLEGVLVNLEEYGLLGDSAASPQAAVKTDASGRYRAKAHIGNQESHTKFRLAGLISGPLTKTRSTKTIDVTRVTVSAERPGYRRFYGIVEVGLASPGEFAVFLQTIFLSPEGCEVPSYTGNDQSWERFDDAKLDPPVVRPGGKVTISVRMQAPFTQGARYEVFATNPGRVFGKNSPKLKPDSSSKDGEVIFRAAVGTTKKPLDTGALVRVLVFRDGMDITPSYLKPMLLQFASAEEDEAARLCDEAWRVVQNGEIAAALEKARRAAQLSPGYPTAQELLGRFAMKANKPEEGLAALKKLVDLRPEDYDGALATYADALITAGKLDEAQSQLEDAFKKIGASEKLKGKPFENLRSVFARCLLSKGDISGAEDQIKKAGVLLPAFVRRLELERARAEVAKTPNDPGSRSALGRALAGGGNWAQAVDEFRAASALRPADPWLRMDLAGALVKGLDRPDLALPELKTAVELSPENAESRQALADCYRLLGRYEDAAEHYEKAAELQPANFLARHWNGVMRLVLGNEERAAAELQEAVKLGREKGRHDVSEQYYYYFSGETVRSLQSGFARPEAEWDYVILDSLATLDSHPENAMARYNLGSALLELGLPEESLAYLEAAAKSLPDNADVKCAVARAKCKLARREEALALCAEALRADPARPELRRQMAELFAERGDDRRAALLLMPPPRCETQAAGSSQEKAK